MNGIKKGFKIGFFVFGMLMISGCGGVDEKVEITDIERDPIFQNEKNCNVDSDCVPVSCCHANDVVNKENAPSCENLKCTASCETILDCGQGRPVCNDGQCGIERITENNLGIEEIEDINNSDCVKEGDGIGDGIILGKKSEECCAGLTPRVSAYVDNDGECRFGESPVCTYCGNGECGIGENKCNCSKDCKE